MNPNINYLYSNYITKYSIKRKAGKDFEINFTNKFIRRTSVPKI